MGALVGAHDNLVVPEGSTCTLVATQVQGNVKVDKGASLLAIAASIRGNVEGNDVAFVLLRFEMQVGGNVQVKGGAPGTATGFDINVRVGATRSSRATARAAGQTFIDAATVGGDVDVLESSGFVEFEFNTVGGNATGAENSGGLSDLGNTVTGNMKVEKNRGPRRSRCSPTRPRRTCSASRTTSRSSVDRTPPPRPKGSASD